MKKSFITTSILTLLVSSVLAQDWQYTTSDGDGYSYDANGVYTDSRGFTVFSQEGLNVVNKSNFENLSYINKNFSVDASKDYLNCTPVYKISQSYEFGGLNVGENVSMKNCDFSGGVYEISSLFHSKPYAIQTSKTSYLENVNFSNSTISYIQKTEGTSSWGVGLYGVSSGLNFSGSNFLVETTSYSAGVFSIYGNTKDLNLSGSQITVTSKADSMASGIMFGPATIENLNVSNSKIDASMGIVEVYGTTINGIIAHNTQFVNLETAEYAICLSSSSNLDFRGATVNVRGSEENTSFSISNISGEKAVSSTNIIMGDGTIYSFANGDITTNLGLVLAEGETFTIAKYEPKDGATTFSLVDSGISAKLTTNSTINGGTIIFEDGETLQLSDGVKLEVSGDTVIDNGTIIFGENASITVSENSELVIADGTEFVLSEGTTVDSVLSTEAGSTIVMAGYETDEEAQQAFGNMFVDESGNVLTFDTSSYNVIGGPAIPEPSTYAIIFGALALGFVMYRRRK